MDANRSLINHIFLPPQLPQALDDLPIDFVLGRTLGDPVRTTTDFVPKVATAKATNCARVMIQDSASTSEHSSSVEFQGAKDAQTGDTTTDPVKGISMMGATSSPRATPAQSAIGQSAQRWASDEDDEHAINRWLSFTHCVCVTSFPRIKVIPPFTEHSRLRRRLPISSMIFTAF